MASGSSPGLVMVPLNGPELPAATTTAMPDCQAYSTAWSNGSVAVGPVGMAPRDRLRTSIPYLSLWLTAQSTPRMTVEMLVAPLAPATLIDTRSAPGASPVYRPLELAPLPATSPATKVPCPYWSVKGELPPVRSTPPMTRLPKSGRLALMPVSRTATVDP